MNMAVPTDMAAQAIPIDEVAAVAERNRCVLLLQLRARSFEKRKLFHISRALIAIAEELGQAERS